MPPVDSNATGSATMTFDSSSNQLTWSIQFSGLSGPAIAAHFHGSAAAGANAGVQINLANISGLNSPMDGSAELTPEQASMLLDGLMYINIHTELYPSDEIRGQVSCVDSPPGEVWETATLVIGDDEFDIKYMISGGTLDELTGFSDTQTLLVSISSASKGTLTIQLPTVVIDSEDDFSVFIDGESGNFVVDELDPTSDARVLQLEFEHGAEEIEIVGTFMAGGQTSEVWETATLVIGDDEFDIQYMISGGTLDDLTGNIGTQTITAMITADQVGNLTIRLPRDIADSVDIDGADSEYIVLVDGVDEESINDDMGQDVRTLTIPFPAQSEQIEIRGTFVVPEFGAIAAIVLAVAIIGIIIGTTRYGKFSFSPKSHGRC